MFNWNDLTFFLEVARHGRVVAAARRLRVDQTTVSRRIAELERDLSTKLFDRKPDGFVLTEHGHQLYMIAEKIEQETTTIPRLLGHDDTMARGRVRMVAMEGISAFFLAERIAPLSYSEPGLVIELATERHLINLTRREADMFISFPEPAGPRLSVTKLGSFRLALYASEAYLDRWGVPKGKGDLSAHTFVDYIEDLVAIQPVHWLLDVIEPTNVSFRSSSMHAQQNAVAAGAGIGLLPLFSAKENPKLTPVLPEQVSVYRDVFLSIHTDIEFITRIRRVRRHLLEIFENEKEYLNEY